MATKHKQPQQQTTRDRLQAVREAYEPLELALSNLILNDHSASPEVRERAQQAKHQLNQLKRALGDIESAQRKHENPQQLTPAQYAWQVAMGLRPRTTRF